MTTDDLPSEILLIIVGPMTSDYKIGLKNDLKEDCFLPFKLLTPSFFLKLPKSVK